MEHAHEVPLSLKVLLVHPHVPMELQYGTRYQWAGAVLPPLGILYIAGVLEREGYAVGVLDANARQFDPAAVLREVQSFGADVVGLTGTTLSFGENIAIAGLLKAWRPELPVVLGGVHAQGTPESCLEYPCFDTIIPGEGEYTMLAYVRALEAGGDLSQVPGLWLRDSAGKPFSTGSGVLVENLDDLPFPARHLLHSMEEYHQKTFGYRVSPHTTMFTQRGCPFRCVFCSSSKQFRDVFDKKIRSHSVDYVRDEIRQLRDNWGIREIYFADDTFNVNKKRVHALCDMFQREFPDLLWSCNFEANICDEELLRHMQAAGCWLIQMGVETGNAKIMEAIQKGITLEQVRFATEMAAGIGLAIKTSFILGNPGETRETIEDTITFAKSLPVHYITFGMMAPLPGTYFWKTADEYGVFNKTAFDKFSMSSASFVPHGLSAGYLAEKQRQAHKQVYFRFDMMKRHLRLIRSVEDIIRYSKSAVTLLS